MIGSLMYLTSSRPDLIHAVCLCAWYQAKPIEKHLQAVKRIFRYLKGTINMGLWYSKDTNMSLTAYADADHGGCQDTRRSTSGSTQFLGDKLVSWSSKKQKCTCHIEYRWQNIFALFWVFCSNSMNASQANKLMAFNQIMSSIIAQQTKLDLELVPKEKRLDIDFPEVYMHQFWDFVYKHDTFYRFKIDKRKRFKLNLEVFRDIFKICPRVQGQDFDALPTDEEIVSFLRDLGHTGEIHSLNDVVVDQMHQPWRTFEMLSSTLVYLERQLEDFIYQIDNKAYKKKEKMYYPRFTKVVIHHFLIQDKTLSWRNNIGMYTSKDDYLINTLRFVSAKEETQIYGAILPDSLTSPEMKETKAYKTYLVSTEEPTGKSKRVKRPAKKTTKAPARGVVSRETPEIPVS
ncbi:hypothetical protein Tco_0392696 [Tanacetum coccineum]